MTNSYFASDFARVYPCPSCQGTGLCNGFLDDPCDHCAGLGTDPDRVDENGNLLPDAALTAKGEG